jgi:hypothetical protein
MANKIQLRRDTSSNWTSSNPTLSQGELGHETNTGKLKVGDGSTAWTSLGYVDTTYTSSNFTHDDLTGFVANEHIDWTADQGSTNIHAGNYTDTTYTHPNHSGEVTSTGDGATVISDNVVDEANLKVSNSPTNGYVLTAQSGNTGGLTWAAAASGGGGGDPDLYAANPSSATDPSATGANAIAIGSNAGSTGTNGIAIGTGADVHNSRSNAIAIGVDAGANGNQSIAMGENALTYSGTTSSIALGYYSKARAGSAVAIGPYADAGNGSARSTSIGYNAVSATGDQATALTNSYASGADSFAAAIGNNTSSYGATGANSVALGYLAKSTGLNAMGFGEGAIASGNDSLALSDATASANNSIAIGVGASASQSSAIAIGKSANSAHQNSVAIGKNAVTTASNQITLGDATATVRISETYTLPTADGTNGQVLTTDGSGAVTFADAGGGGGGGDPDLYRDNAVSATTPTASGDNAVAIGSNARATGSRSVSIGFNTNSTQNYNVSIGHAAASAGVGGLAIGYDARADASYANAIGRSLANGQDSLAGAIGTNSGSYGASAANSIAMGKNAKATNTGAVAIGYEPQATGLYSIAIGDTNTTGREAVGIGENNTASGLRNTVIGYGSTGTADYSTTLGVSAADQGIKSRFALSGSTFNNDGDSQAGMFPLRTATTDATATALTTDGNAASTNNQIILPNNSAYSFSGTIIARESAAAGSDYASWEIKGALLRDANAASTVLGNGIVNKLYASAGASAWAVALSADTTNGGLKVEITGAAATNIRWVATVNTSEVTYA